MTTVEAIQNADGTARRPMRHELGRQHPAHWSRLSVAAAYFLAFIGLTLISLWRIPPRDQGVIWAEDGNVFISQAIQPHAAWTPFQPYAGYLHLLPRLLTEVVVRFFPVSSWANAVTVLACMVVAAVALITFHSAKVACDSVWIRSGWAAIPIFVNVGAIEPLGNFANLHWYLLWLTPWLLIKPAKSVLEGSFLFAIAAAISFTEIISVLFVPLFLYRLKDKRFWPARAGLSLGLACQAYTTLVFPRAGNPEYDLDPLSILYGWFLNTAGPIVYGDSGQVLRQIVSFGPMPAILSSLIIVTILLAVFVFGTSTQRWMGGLLVGSSILVWTACILANPAEYLDYAQFTASDWFEYFLFSRYSMVPTMFILAVIPLLGQSISRYAPQIPLAVGIGFAVLLASMYFVPGTRRDGGPVWAEETEKAASFCAEGYPHYDFATAPEFYKGVVAIQCSDLLNP